MDTVDQTMDVIVDPVRNWTVRRKNARKRTRRDLNHLVPS